MKNYIYLPIIMFTAFLFISCEDSTTEPGTTTPTTGTLYVQSTPTGAQIWVDGTNTGKVTPDSVKDLSAGNHSLTLKIDGYRDSVQTNINITAGQTTTRNITLTRAAFTFGAVRLWETTGTDSTQPSGLDLSTGTAYGISSTNKGNVDIYYSSNGFVIRSANAASELTRVTSFKVGSASNLTDGVDSPLKDNTWLTQMSDREINYVFLYDNDLHYSKLKITGFGGGAPGDPAWIQVQFTYNEQANSRIF